MHFISELLGRHAHQVIGLISKTIKQILIKLNIKKAKKGL
jgi:hypothetical protein